MATKTKPITLRVSESGTIVIPTSITRALNLSPHQTIILETRDNTLIFSPTPSDNLNRIGELLRYALADAEWENIEASREDRWF